MEELTMQNNQSHSKWESSQFRENLKFKGLTKPEAILVIGLMLFAIAYALIRPSAGITKSVVIMQTADTHGIIYPYDYEAGAKTKTSMAQLASLITDERNAGHELILIDCGNCTKGNLIENFSDDVPGPAVSVLNHLGYDVFVPGNDEISGGTDALAKMSSEFSGSVLASNISSTDKSSFSDPYLIIDKNGIKVAVFGVIAGCGNDFPDISDPVEAAGNILDEISDSADLIIGCVTAACESSDALRCAELIANEYGSRINALFLGGCEETVYTAVNGVPMLGPGQNAAYISKLFFTFREKGNKLELELGNSTMDLLDGSEANADKDFLLQFARLDQKCLDLAEQQSQGEKK